MKKIASFNILFYPAILFMLLYACAGGKSNNSNYIIEQHPPFTFGDVFYQDWVAGIKEGGSGTNLHVSFASFTEDVVILDIFFRNKIVKAQRSPQYRNSYVGYFKNEMQPDVIMDIDPAKEAQNTPPIVFPFDLNHDEAVLSYLHGDQIKYVKITEIRREEMLAYPSTKPKGEN